LRLVILGLGTGGFASLLSARKTDFKAEITVIDEKEFDLLHPCGFPYALEGLLEFENLKHNIGLERMKIKKIKGKTEKIDAENKKVSVNGKEIEFDSLIISVGAVPLIPPIKGIKELSGKKVFCVHSIEETKKLNEKIEKGKTAIVIGAGAIGLETAFALNKKGMKVKVIEAAPQILGKAFDLEMAVIAEEFLKEKDIEILTGKKVSETTEKSVFVEGKEIPADLIILSAGIKPNTDFLKDSGIELSDKGFIKVNEFLETNKKGIFAAGDSIEIPNIINKKAIAVGLANSAYSQGLIAGPNALGKQKKYSGTTLTFVSVLGELEIAATGFTKAFAEKQGIETVEAKAKGKNKYNWFPGSKELTVKLVAEKNSGKIIGCQAIGKDAFVRVNVISATIKAGMTAEELSGVELAYCPPLSETHDILLLADELLKRKLEK